MTQIKVAIIGCGSISEQGHLPGVELVDGATTSVVVDRDPIRATAVAEKFGIPNIKSSVDGIGDLADAAVVALPHHLHCEVALEIIKQGVHLLMEKPFALSVAECDKMITAAEEAGVILAAGMTRRFFWANQYIATILKAGLLGRPKLFRFEDGNAYAWPSTTPFVLSRDHSGGGVLMGNGTHVLDTVVWWFGEPEAFTFCSDAVGGIETDCVLEMSFSNGLQGIVELSRSRALSNMYHIECENGVVEASLYGNKVSIIPNDCVHALSGTVQPTCSNQGGQGLPHLMASQISNLADAIRLGVPPAVPGKEARRSIGLIEDCYKQAKPLWMPWLRPIGLSSVV